MSGAPFLPVAWCLAAAALFGASSPAAKHLLTTTSPLQLAGLLYLGAALGALPFSFRGGSAVARRRAANLARMAGVVVFGGVLGPTLLLLGLARAPAASVSLWLNLEAAATALLGWALFKEHLGRRALVGVALVTAASALLAGATGAALVPAALLVAAACVCWGLDNNLQALVDGFTPAQSTCAKGVVAGVVNLALATLVERPAYGAGDVVAALALGALAYGASIVLYVRSAHQLGATRAQLLFASAPFSGTALSWAALGEAVAAPPLAAGALMIVALVVVHREAHGHAHVHEATTHTHWHRHDDGHHEHAHDPTVRGGHVHAHDHDAVAHAHPHRPDLHHRHEH